MFYTQPFDTQCRIAIPHSAHGFNTSDLRIQILSAELPARVLLDTDDLANAQIAAAIVTDSLTHDVTISLVIPESGQVILSPA